MFKVYLSNIHTVEYQCLQEQMEAFVEAQDLDLCNSKKPDLPLAQEHESANPGLILLSLYPGFLY